MAEPHQPRQAARRAVLKRAKLVFHDSVVDCLVLNVSETGARVQLAGPIPVPNEVTVHFSGGVTYRAEQCWIKGLEFGFQFLGPAQLGGADRVQAWDFYEAVRGKGLDALLQRMRDLRFFDDPGLSQAAVDAEAALKQLEVKLRVLGTGAS